jgi:FKBP-type peptidyl-prolyl cis-trans isomerase SlpA
MTKIQQNSKVSLRYQLNLQDGTEVEGNADIEPLVFIVGDNTLTSGMEDALLNYQAGDKISVTLAPEQAYGYPDKNNVHAMPASDFPGDLKPEINQVISFDGMDDEEIMGTIIEIKDDEVIVDFSHPLAGHTLIFEAEIISVEI